MSSFETCVFHVDHKAPEEHLVNNPLQSDLDGCLECELQIVQRKERELSHVAPKLTMYLQSGAKWNSDAMLDDQKTPYHIICESPGDHHELLDLMIKSSQRTIIDTQDIYKHTALMYAVKNTNINCLKCLITNGADIDIGNDIYQFLLSETLPQDWCAIMSAIWMLRSDYEYTSVNKDIFELVLDNVVDIDKLSFNGCLIAPIIFAVDVGNVYCIKKLIEKGARLDFTYCYQPYVWSMIARIGDVELLKCMLNRGFDKDTTDQDGLSVLWYVVASDNVEAVRYLLDLGVTIPTYTADIPETQCDRCKENTLIIDDDKLEGQEIEDPCMRAISNNKLEIVKLLDEYGCQSYKSFSALRRAMIFYRKDVVSYLLNKYTYPLNIEYIILRPGQSSYEHGYTFLTDPYFNFDTDSNLHHHITKLLLDHGADPAKPMCATTSANAMMTAIHYGRSLKVIAQYIRSGVDINFRSYDRTYGKVLPFEASVLRGYNNVAKILLLSGCSCGKFSLANKREDKVDLKLEKLMKEWNVQENNVIPLQLRCRNVILNHLSPRADMKIEKLPLPALIVKFLSISELDAILDLLTKDI